MPSVVSISDIAAAMDLPNEDWESFLDPESGEIITVTEEDRRVLDDPEQESLADWQDEQLCRVRAVLDSGRCLRLPVSFEIHERSIMERFCRTADDPSVRNELLDAIHGSGAFRQFRRTVECLGLLDQWYSFREGTFESIARDWLESRGIPYR